MFPRHFETDVLRGKKVLIRCGGGFHQECSQSYSPVAKWIENADVALNDEDMATWMKLLPPQVHCYLMWRP